MPDVNTNFYALVEPEVGGSTDTWGTKLNDNLASIDNLIGVPRPQYAVVDPTTGLIDASTAAYFQLTPSQNVALSFNNVPIGSVCSAIWLVVLNGGNFTITYPSGVSFVAGVPPVLNTAGNDILLFVTGDNGVHWTAAHIGVPDGISTAQLADGSVTAPKMAGLGSIKLKSATDSAGTIQWATENYKTVLLHDGTHPSRITIPSGFGGLVQLSAHLELLTTTTGRFQVTIAKNGSRVVPYVGRQISDTPASGGVNIGLDVLAFDNPADGDYYEVFWSALVGGAGLTQASSCWFAAHRVLA